MDILDNAQGLGSAVAQALTAGAGAISAARAAADALAAGDVEQAKACLSPYQNGHGTYASDLVYDHPAQSVTDSMPAQPTGTTGY
jgi:hypothetical protein